MATRKAKRSTKPFVAKQGKKRKLKAIDPEISERLKDIPEQILVVGPLVQYLTDLGWCLDQIIFGKTEWLVPKSPSEQTKREKGKSYKM